MRRIARSLWLGLLALLGGWAPHRRALTASVARRCPLRQPPCRHRQPLNAMHPKPIRMSSRSIATTTKRKLRRPNRIPHRSLLPSGSSSPSGRTLAGAGRDLDV
jgi:hypothetical protein